MVKLASIPDKWIRLALHAIAWSVVIIIPLYLSSAFGGGNRHHVYEFYIHSFSAGVIFYMGYLYLVPHFFLKEKKLIYIALLIGLILATYFISNFIKEYLFFHLDEYAPIREAVKNAPPKDEGFRPPIKVFSFFNHCLSSILVSGFAIGLGVMETLKQNEKKQKELEKEKLNSELAFLKNQVSPHFFFNTLNNIYSLIGIDGPTAQESVLKLSKLMRYLLYESEHGETPIRNEIGFMNNYIDLMKLRLSPKVELNVDFPKECADFTIPPLLFVPFIENAFKHGVSYRERSFINISMVIDARQIRFISENSIGKTAKTDLQHSGIGLENVRKRLNLLFPEKHELKIENNGEVFRAELTIQRQKTKI